MKHPKAHHPKRKVRRDLTSWFPSSRWTNFSRPRATPRDLLRSKGESHQKLLPTNWMKSRVIFNYLVLEYQIQHGHLPGPSLEPDVLTLSRHIPSSQHGRSTNSWTTTTSSSRPCCINTGVGVSPTPCQ